MPSFSGPGGVETDRTAGAAALAAHGTLAVPLRISVTPNAVSHGDTVDRGFGRAVTVAVMIGILAAVVAGATIWLLVTDPVTVANAVEQGELSPLVMQLAEVLYDALVGLLGYL
jgi:hypothetical protein